ncbi:hypothetical protein O1611_g8289 [Lasiodiplodia mahajangana]|uniref:Uncharacterized protein n=1 Tax=Lasiodiplodia mahajangana TaxID=1108764 RepID=A0ACC2JDA3_9PEZI|nr:hypothetical protein O1611_g8289 [Lasiodiplodia mahajangana]
MCISAVERRHDKSGPGTAYGIGTDVARVHANIRVGQGAQALDVSGSPISEDAVELGWEAKTSQLNGRRSCVSDGEARDGLTSRRGVAVDPGSGALLAVSKRDVTPVVLAIIGSYGYLVEREEVKGASRRG